MPRSWVGGATNGDRPAPLSPRCFLAAGEACGAVPVQARLPAGQGTENLRRKSATKERRRRISGPQAPTTEGLEGPERARTIRRTAAKKRRRQTRFRGSGALRRHALDPTAGREADDHQLVEAQRKPGVCLPTWRPADMPLVLSMVGGNSGYPRLAFWEPKGSSRR